MRLSAERSPVQEIQGNAGPACRHVARSLNYKLSAGEKGFTYKPERAMNPDCQRCMSRGRRRFMLMKMLQSGIFKADERSVFSPRREIKRLKVT